MTLRWLPTPPPAPTPAPEVETGRADVTETGLTMPANHWCPGCGIHNRSQDGYGGNPHKFLPLCPVCSDKRERGEVA